jgi:excisionase family DNA binding protein
MIECVTQRARLALPFATPVDVGSVGQAAYFEVSKSSLYKLAQDGKVPGQKVGRHWRFHRETIDAWLTASPVARVEVLQPRPSARSARKERDR